MSEQQQVVKRFWHELSDAERRDYCETPGNTVRSLLDTFAQPSWCLYPDALAHAMGCWSLTMVNHEVRVTNESCKARCNLHREHKHTGSDCACGEGDSPEGVV